MGDSVVSLREDVESFASEKSPHIQGMVLAHAASMDISRVVNEWNVAGDIARREGLPKPDVGALKTIRKAERNLDLSLRYMNPVYEGGVDPLKARRAAVGCANIVKKIRLPESGKEANSALARADASLKKLVDHLKDWTKRK